MNRSLPRWVARLAALALLVGVLGLGYAFLVAPVFAAYRTLDEDIARSEELLHRYETLAGTRAAHEARLGELSSRQRGTGVYLSGAGDALAAAELQERARKAVVSEGAELRSIQNLPPESDGEFRRVTVRVQFSGNLAAFHSILYRLEAGRPFVFVDNLDLRNRRAARSSARENLDPLLTVRFDLSGYLNPETAP